MYKQIVLSVAIVLIVVGLSGYILGNGIPNPFENRDERFVGTWKLKDSSPTLTFFSDGMGSSSGIGIEWKIKDGQIIITTGNDEFVMNYEYKFTDDNTKLHLRSAGSEEYLVYEKV